jgi:hypothetical protein
LHESAFDITAVAKGSQPPFVTNSFKTTSDRQFSLCVSPSQVVTSSHSIGKDDVEALSHSPDASRGDRRSEGLRKSEIYEQSQHLSLVVRSPHSMIRSTEVDDRASAQEGPTVAIASAAAALVALVGLLLGFVIYKRRSDTERSATEVMEETTDNGTSALSLVGLFGNLETAGDEVLTYVNAFASEVWPFDTRTVETSAYPIGQNEEVFLQVAIDRCSIQLADITVLYRYLVNNATSHSDTAD